MCYTASFGKINIDMLYGVLNRLPSEGEEIYSPSFKMEFGGGFPATMVTTHRLNVPSKLITVLGDDIFSCFAKEKLKEYKLPYILIKSDKFPLNLTSAAITKTNRSFLSYGEDFEFTDMQKQEIYEQLKDAEVIPVQQGLLEVYKQLKAEGKILCLDTGFFTGMSKEKLKPYYELADYYTPSIDEARVIFGTDDKKEIISCLREYFEKPILKLGKDGVAVFDGEYYEIPAERSFKCIDSTGAGDTFLGGFIYGLYRGFSFRECVECGNLTGGKCVTGMGCLSEFLTEEELLSRLGKI